MIDRGALRQIFADVSGVLTIWDGDPEPFGALLKVSIPTMPALGVDDQRAAFNPSTKILSYTSVGTRIATVELRYQEQVLDAPGYDVLDRVRTRLRRPDIRARLTAASLALVDVGPALDISATVDNRAIWLATMTLRLAVGVSDDGSTPTPPSYIRANAAKPQTLSPVTVEDIEHVNSDRGVPFDP